MLDCDCSSNCLCWVIVLDPAVTYGFLLCVVFVKCEIVILPISDYIPYFTHFCLLSGGIKLKDISLFVSLFFSASL